MWCSCRSGGGSPRNDSRRDHRGYWFSSLSHRQKRRFERGRYRMFSSAYTVSEIIHSVSQSACSILSALNVSRPLSTVISNARLQSGSGWGLDEGTYFFRRVGPINESIPGERAGTGRLTAVWRLVRDRSTPTGRAPATLSRNVRQDPVKSRRQGANHVRRRTRLRPCPVTVPAVRSKERAQIQPNSS